VRKLENFWRFSFGPLTDRVFRIGLTTSVAFGVGNDALIHAVDESPKWFEE